VIIDAHTHVWPRWPYRPDVPDSDTRGRAENLLLEMDRAGVDVAFVVNARIDNAHDNNDYGFEVATEHPTRLLQVADIDSRFGPDYHRSGAADRLRAVIDRYRPVGVSHYLEPVNDGWFRSDEGAEFLRVAEASRLIVTLAAPPAWYDDLRYVARAHPDLTIIVNHLAVVTLYPDGVQAALDLVLDEQDVPNLLVKVSGYYYGHDRPWDYPYLDRLPIVKAFYESWGPDRMVWASDWPSLLPHHSYTQAVRLLGDHADFLSVDDRARIQGGTLEALLRDRGAVR
jgi:predicted TIM-barrel fold metal-dependent hydrolase